MLHAHENGYESLAAGARSQHFPGTPAVERGGRRWPANPPCALIRTETYNALARDGLAYRTTRDLIHLTAAGRAAARKLAGA
jgi:hypothetical protein